MIKHIHNDYFYLNLHKGSATILNNLHLKCINNVVICCYLLEIKGKKDKKQTIMLKS